MNNDFGGINFDDLPNLDPSLKGSLQELLQKTQEMQQGIVETQRQIAEKIFTGSVGGNIVRIHMSGAMEVRRIDLSAEFARIVNQDLEQAKELLKSAFNDARNKAEGSTRSSFMELSKQLGLPPEMMPQFDQNEGGQGGRGEGG